MTGRNPITLCRLVAERSQEEGWHEPYELRGSRTVLWGTGGEIPLVYPAVAGTLSGGEQQMLAIGRSLMSKPKLLMMDEPSIGLSPLVKSYLVNSIRDIWKSGMTVLLVEQDSTLTLNLAERAYVVEHGRVGLEGKSERLMDNEEVKRVYFQIS